MYLINHRLDPSHERRDQEDVYDVSKFFLVVFDYMNSAGTIHVSLRKSDTNLKEITVQRSMVWKEEPGPCLHQPFLIVSGDVAYNVSKLKPSKMP